MNTPNGKVGDVLELSSPVGNIPLLAIQAAEELDELARGRQSPSGSVAKIISVIRNSLFTNDAGAKKSFVDSTNITVFSRAYDGWVPENKIATTSKLVLKAKEIVKSLEQSSGAHKKADLEKLRDFCLALATATASYGEAIDDFRPSQSLWS